MRFNRVTVEDDEKPIYQRNIEIRLDREKKVNWHKHFAWLPVKVGQDTYAWLETVERSFPKARYGYCETLKCHCDSIIWLWGRPSYRVLNNGL